MGRPKGSKNKPKLLPPLAENILPKEEAPVEAVEAPVEAVEAPVETPETPPPEVVKASKHKTEVPKDHILYQFYEYALKHMHPTQLVYYKSKARKTGYTLEHLMMKAFTGFFLIEDKSIKI